jgi:anti-anti-sigma factor
MMEVTEIRAGGATILRIAGRVDSSVSKVLELRIQDLITRDEHIVVDLAGMSYVSSAGLRSFIILAKHARAREKAIALAAMQDEVCEIFEISGLIELFVIHGTVDAAVAALPR